MRNKFGNKQWERHIQNLTIITKYLPIHYIHLKLFDYLVLEI
jgi:hypothetical protein